MDHPNPNQAMPRPLQLLACLPCFRFVFFGLVFELFVGSVCTSRVFVCFGCGMSLALCPHLSCRRPNPNSELEPSTIFAGVASGKHEEPNALAQQILCQSCAPTAEKIGVQMFPDFSGL